ncbi:homoserine kinase [Psychroserpens sp.]|uniref:homoserine kinase n=1 Tax=Psychroserpens sp. TaxID=2020870 RepID=UPI001B2F22EE|nr:homoserine kinase [Psychroserpens sp.]MBO6607088.1 homoserine kinase [Psychroserpens sp.]MBO6630817.1 homoserine kinase [Psychroserpens sp.]MBO6654234.1 homoserine kinase [Psychroserpens sp.]MBO6682480.1 homoserine kinase [Psychroserpens sp.]MBO6750860.1 homoserine kinase [Psychroserpens sp.]
MNEIKLFSPATVANVSCGFDVLGFCLDTIGDEMIIRKTDKKGIHITKVAGFDLPLQTELNVAGVSAIAIYDAAQPDFGFEIEIYKNIKPGSGVGSSSASASGSVFGINELLGRPYSNLELVKFAMKGEALASQSEHADNIAPGIYGGFTLVKSISPLEILELPCPDDLYAVILHPQIEIKTADARALLPKEIPLQDAITQWSNVGSLVHALHTNDYQLLSRSLNDVVIEPHRCALIPGFNDVKNTAIGNGALGCGISGSGPSIFSICKGESTAKSVAATIEILYSKTEIPFEIYISKINTQGIKIL